MNFLAAIIAGLAGTVVMSIIMALAPRMGMPEMDIVGMLSSMFGVPPNRMLGWIMHLMMGVVFAILYALLWNLSIGIPGTSSGALFGAVHWIASGIIMGLVPMVHVGVKSGEVISPGVFMMNNDGVMAFMGGLIGHIAFGLVVGLVYTLF
jgi:hypothetical protein